MSKPTNVLYEFGPFLLNATEQLLLCEGRPVPLKPKVFGLLLVLVQNSGHLLSKDELMRQVWPDSFVEESNLSVSIFALRKALRDGLNNSSYIETVPRRGYRFVADAKEVFDEDGSLKKRHSTDAFGGIGTGSIAVLPFRVIGAKADDEYLGLGLANALITKLTNLRQIRVRPTCAVLKYTDAPEIIVVGRELRVDALLEGSIQKSRERIRVTVQLVDARDGEALWAKNFDEKLDDIFSVEDSISDQVVRALSIKLTSDEKTRLVRHHTGTIEAYHWYLKGTYFLNKRTSEGLRKASESFETAVARDPNYAMAYAGLADARNLLASYGVLPTNKSIPGAKEAALKALALDDSLAEAHAALAHIQTREWNWSEAEKEFKHEAWAEIKLAQELDPVSLNINANIGALFYHTRQYDQAIEQLLATLELDPHFAYADFVLGLVYEAKGEYENALTQYRKARPLLGESQGELTACLGRAYALSGKRDKARKVVDQLKALSEQGYELRYYIALIYLALGDSDRAFAWLEQAYDVREEGLGLLRIDPMLDTLRVDPRFISLLDRVGLM